MAKASQADLNMAIELTNALEALAGRWGATMPEKIERVSEGEETEHFDLTDHAQCMRVIEYLQGLVGSASLMRVVWGALVMLDPRNELVDPDADTIEHHPAREKTRAALTELVRLRDLEATIRQRERDGYQPGMHSTQEEIDAWAHLTADLRNGMPKAWEAARTAIAAAGQQP